jgi:outer membrane protein OmpA-like peptidoglycan-associated protein
MGKRDESAQWISMSDMMTGLMLIFLLIAVSFMYQVQLKQKEQNKILFEYNDAKEKMYDELKSSFSEKSKQWGMKLNKNLSINFNVDFDPDSYQLKPELKEILDKFIPEYIKIINEPKYKQRVKEVRIEGHT